MITSSPRAHYCALVGIEVWEARESPKRPGLPLPGSVGLVLHNKVKNSHPKNEELTPKKRSYPKKRAESDFNSSPNSLLWLTRKKARGESKKRGAMAASRMARASARDVSGVGKLATPARRVARAAGQSAVGQQRDRAAHRACYL